jgi:acetyl-CoA C-acetyltransferase
LINQKPTAHVYGAAVTLSWRDSSMSLVDLIFAGVTAALDDAGTHISEVDSVVLAAHDLIDGRSLSSMVTAPAAGAYLRDEIRLSDDGLAAMSLASARVESGESEVSVVAAWGRASEGDFLRTSRAAMDPFMHQPLGMSEIDVSAFRLSRWIAEYPGAEDARRQAAIARRERVERNPRALLGATTAIPVSYPLWDEEAPKWADVVAAVIIGSKKSPISVAGVGHSTDIPQIGDRDLLEMSAVRAALPTALSGAGITLDDIGIIEIDGMMLSDEVIAMEALGLCPPGEGFQTYAQSTRVNQSGGSGAGWCYPAMGLVRLAECYLRLRDDEPKPGSGRRTALAIGTGPVGAQTSTAMVLEAE